MDSHMKSYKTDKYKKCVINMGTKELKLFLLLHTFYSVEEFVSL